MQIGGFDWTLTFTWHGIPDGQMKTLKESDPVKSPTMAGGLFAIGKTFWSPVFIFVRDGILSTISMYLHK